MNIFLLARNLEMIIEWKEQFEDATDVDVILDDFQHFMSTHKVQCVVSPANSYGLMDGGYDAAITEYFGNNLQAKVQQYILDNFFGEQPVGSSFIIDIPDSDQKLIHTPTMRIPSRIKDSEIVYHCMRSTLITAIKNNVESIVIPAFGGATGKVPYRIIAELMKKAYDQINNPPAELTWETVI